MVTGMIPWDDYQDDPRPEADPRGEAISGRDEVGTRP